MSCGPAGISTRGDDRELNVNFSTISRLGRFTEFLSTSNQPHNPQTMRNHASPGPPYLASSPAGWSETSHTNS